MKSESGVSFSHYPNEDNGIILIEAAAPIDPSQWIKQNLSLIEGLLLKHGGILLRGFNIYSLSEFNRLSQIICPNLLNYTYRSTPRTNLGGKIYTATEYPADQHIPLHNENSYSDSWPQKIMFFCVIPPEEGGMTPIADSRRIFRKIDHEIVKKFEENRILYVRNYTAGIDLSWQEVFQTSEKSKVEEYCIAHSIEYLWKKHPELTTKQICQATLEHPVTKEKVWFNQAHLFHISSLKQEIKNSLTAEVGENNYPRNTFYGDGTPIEEKFLEHIRDIYNQERILFKWQRGDVMVLDNLLMAHGRTPFSGERKIAVAMG
jgi:alpha-ketoglutarate-dependent taurine dioxygenase